MKAFQGGGCTSAEKSRLLIASWAHPWVRCGPTCLHCDDPILIFPDFKCFGWAPFCTWHSVQVTYKSRYIGQWHYTDLVYFFAAWALWFVNYCRERSPRREVRVTKEGCVSGQLSSCPSMRQVGAGWHGVLGGMTRAPRQRVSTLVSSLPLWGLQQSALGSPHLVRVSMSSLNKHLPSPCQHHTIYLIGCSLCLHRTHSLEEKEKKEKILKLESGDWEMPVLLWVSRRGRLTQPNGAVDEGRLRGASWPQIGSPASPPALGAPAPGLGFVRSDSPLHGTAAPGLLLGPLPHSSAPALIFLSGTKSTPNTGVDPFDPGFFGTIILIIILLLGKQLRDFCRNGIFFSSKCRFCVLVRSWPWGGSWPCTRSSVT